MNRLTRRASRAHYARSIPRQTHWEPFESVPYSTPHPSGNLVAFVSNNLYSVQVFLRRSNDRPRGYLHLAVRRHDESTDIPWHHLQRIKNEVVSPNQEAVEVFPRHEDLVDSANMRHIFVLPDGESAFFSIKGKWV